MAARSSGGKSSGRSRSSRSQSGRSQAGRKPAQGGRGSPEKMTPAAVSKYFKGMDFPADKQSLIQRAQESGAPTAVMQVLNKMPEGQYRSAADIGKGFSKAK